MSSTDESWLILIEPSGNSVNGLKFQSFTHHLPPPFALSISFWARIFFWASSVHIKTSLWVSISFMSLVYGLPSLVQVQIGPMAENTVLLMQHCSNIQMSWWCGVCEDWVVHIVLVFSFLFGMCLSGTICLLRDLVLGCCVSILLYCSI
jgi:hypothetical protein